MDLVSRNYKADSFELNIKEARAYVMGFISCQNNLKGSKMG